MCVTSPYHSDWYALLEKGLGSICGVVPWEDARGIVAEVRGCDVRDGAAELGVSEEVGVGGALFGPGVDGELYGQDGVGGGDEGESAFGVWAVERGWGGVGEVCEGGAEGGACL